MTTVTVYSKENCAACQQTKRFLEREGIPYKEVNLSQVPELVEKFKAEGFMAAPVVVTPHKTWCGFRLDELKALTYLQRSERSSFLDSAIRDVKSAAQCINNEAVTSQHQSQNTLPER